MNSNIDFEVYLFLSTKEIVISVNERISFKTIYQNETLIDLNSEEFNYKKINEFLEENIFVIEKTLKKFIQKIDLIIDSKAFFSVLVSVKNKNYNELISRKKLDYLLNEAKSQCQETVKGYKINHMIIDNYLINDKNNQFLKIGEKYKSFSIDLRFICLSEKIIKDFEQILSKYQISLNQVVNAEYIKEFFKNDTINIFNMANKIINGCNENEVKIVSKRHIKRGFFERFFDLFG
tara:strand:- start:9721 stop:10425 length:705 start_codon:yes stop_codon:yes gene_type:complete